MKRAFVSLFVLSCLVFASLAGADEPQETASAQPEETATAPVDDESAEAPLAALRVVIDPDTGRVRAPTAEELERMASRWPAAKTREQPDIQRGADGVLTAIVPSGFMKAATATVGEDGQVEVEHDVLPVEVVKATGEETTEESADGGEGEEN